MNKASENKEDAGKFVAYLASEEAMEVYGKAGGTPPVPAVLAALAEQRPEFPLVGEHADKYGFVVKGGTAANAVPVYEVLAEHFSSSWAGLTDPDSALSAAAEGMREVQQRQ
jgi:multiple sugar transport system substrate-binding protein